MPTNDPAGLLAAFEEGRVDPRQFPHREHVRIGYEMLERRPFPEALLHLARGLRRMAARAGRPETYHETITAAFLAVIAERRVRRLGGFRGAQCRSFPKRVASGNLRTGGAAIDLRSPDFHFATEVAQASSLPLLKFRKLEACATPALS